MKSRTLLKIFFFFFISVCIYTIGNTTGQGIGVFSSNEDTATTDSTILKQRADSIAALRTYMRSKQYNDSIDAVRRARLDSIRVARQAYNDSIKQERLRVNDSIAVERKKTADSMRSAMIAIREARQAEIDSIKEVRQKVNDSLSEIRDYRTSEAYKDSVAAVRTALLEQKKAEQRRIMDSNIAVRKAEQAALRKQMLDTRDSIKAINDSIRTVRNRELDSIRAIRQQFADSMKLVREKRELEREKREEEKAKKKKLALELKIQKKKDKYSNEDFRKKPWNIVRQIIQNTTTRYNYFFNANKKMNEAEQNMYASRSENLDSTIRLMVFDPNADSTKMLREMDSLIHRIAVGIQIHDPRAKWQDDLYFLLGKSFYYKGDYDNAAAAFQYIIAEAEKVEREKNKANKNPKEKNSVKEDFITKEEEASMKKLLYHTPTKNDAILWLSRVYLKKQELIKAELLMNMAKKSNNLPERLKGELNLLSADYYLSQNQYTKALPYLDSLSANNEVEKYQRARAAFLAAQLYEQSQDWEKSSTFYERVIDMKPDFDIELKSRVNQINTNLKNSNADPLSTIKNIKQLIGESKYKDYRDQLYFGLGNAYIASNNNTEGIESYRESIKLNAKNQSLKGRTYYALGDLYYNTKDYLKAKSAYDSAMMLLTEKDNPYYQDATNKSLGLNAVAAPRSLIRNIDSLLLLAEMSPKDQRAAIRKHIRNLENEKPIAASTSSKITTAGSSAGSWYFGNNVLIEKGAAEFKQKWGNRPLKDNWRRSAGSFGSEPQEIVENIEKEQKLNEDDFLAMIPKEKYILDSLRLQRNNLEFALGKAFFNLMDYNNASTSYHTFLTNTPQSSNHEDALHDLYLIALRSHNDSLAAYYQTRLAASFPNSTYIQRQSTAIKSDTQPTASIEKHFQDTYARLTQDQFREVIIKTEEAYQQYPKEMPYYQEQYNLMNAIAYAGLKEYGRADTMLTQFIAVSANSRLKEWATDVHNYIKGIKSDSTVADKIVTEIKSGDMAIADYIFDENAPHIVLIKTKTLDGKFMGLKAGITDYNSFKNANLHLTAMLSSLGDNQELIAIRSFDNAANATLYMNRIRGEQKLFKDYPNHTNLTFLIISQDNYSKLLERKNLAEYMMFQKQNQSK